MNKVELIDAVSKKLETTKKETSEYIDVIFNVISDELSSNNMVKISGFGTFGVTERSERQGRNPSTGKSMLIPASKSPKFKAAKSLKDKVNQ